MNTRHLLTWEMQGSVQSNSATDTKASSKLLLHLKGHSATHLALFGWSPLELSGDVQIEGELEDKASIAPGSGINIGPPFHKKSNIHIEFHDKKGRTWRLLGSGAARLPRPWKTGSSFSGDLFVDGKCFGSWRLMVSPKSISIAPGFYQTC